MHQNPPAAPDWLRTEHNRGYGKLPIPSPRDEQISTLLMSWATLDRAACQTTSQIISNDQRNTLLAFSERMASLAVREQKAQKIHDGLLAFGFAYGGGDQRDALPILSLLHDAALRLNADPTQIFETAANFMPANAAEALRSFLRRSCADKHIHVMGYVTSTDQDGFRYTRTW